MKRLTFVVAAAAIAAPLFTSGAALADKMPASVLVETCNRTDEDAVAVCSAYFMGVLEGLSMGKQAIDVSRPICFTRMTPMQAKGEFLTYVKAHKPSDRADARDVVMNVLFEEHTCPAHNN